MQFGNGNGFYFSKVVICCSLFVNCEGGALFIFKIKNEQCNEDDISNNEKLNYYGLRFLGWWCVLL